MKMLQPRVTVANMQTAMPQPKIANPFYNSRGWIELRDRVRREAGGRCQTPGCGRAERRMFADHIVELQDGGAPLERSNAWLQCGACHSRKTAAERAKRMAARPPGGGDEGLVGNGGDAAWGRTQGVFPVR